MKRSRDWRRLSVARHAPVWLRSALVDVLLLAIFWLLFFWPILISRDHRIPHDLLDQHYMFQVLVHDALRDGRLPVWTPFIVGGYPIAADPLAMLFYPPNLLMHLFTPRAFLPYLSVEALLTLHILWAAVGAYALARTLTGSRAGALVAGLVFGFNGFFAWHISHLSPVSAVSWLPWILLAYERAIRLRSLAWTGVGAAAFGVMALAGYALTILQATYLLAAITAVIAWHAWRRDRHAALWICLIGATILILGAGLSMVQTLPAAELTALTARAEYSFWEATSSSFAPYWLLTLLLPNFFSVDGPAPYWAPGDPAEVHIYTGLLTLFLAGVGLVHAVPRDRSLTRWILSGGVAALVLAFGSFAWPYRVAFDLLLGIDSVRRPIGFVVLAHLALALLAGYGVKALQAKDAFQRSDALRALISWLRLGMLAALGILLLASVLLVNASTGPTQHPLIPIISGTIMAGVILLAAYLVLRHAYVSRSAPALAVLVLIIALDLGTAHAGRVYNSSPLTPWSYIGPDWTYNAEDPLVRTLRQERDAAPGSFRIYPEAISSEWANGPLVWGLESANGYTVLWPLHYQRFYDAATADLTSPLFDMLNVRYVVTSSTIEELRPDADASSFRLAYDGHQRVYENLDVYPRAWVAGRVVVQSEEQVLPWMQARPEQLKNLVVLSEAPPEAAAVETAASGTVDIRSYDETRVVLQATLAQPGFVILTDTWYPGWQARVDGQPTHIYRANEAFRAVWVPAGEHEVVFSYTPTRLSLGLLTSGISLALILGAIIIGLWVDRAARRAQAELAPSSRDSTVSTNSTV